ncbi:MAG: thiamine pyrophosphate-dependent enzyme [SAR324 cluster bacterium]|nr:thiamine pyrophosphate-dependent enzyme [SAR324 cluster bacterium]
MIDRVEGCKYLLSRIDKDDLLVGGVGNPASDLAAAEDRDLNFYMWNAMGSAASFALGLAMARPEKRVILLHGEGCLLMNLGALATETVRYPDNLIHIVWDNRMYHLTGKQPSATAFLTDLAKVAEGCGFEHVARCETLDAFKAALDKALVAPGPHFILALNDDKDPVGHFPASPTYIKHRFMTALGVDAQT